MFRPDICDIDIDIQSGCQTFLQTLFCCGIDKITLQLKNNSIPLTYTNLSSDVDYFNGHLTVQWFFLQCIVPCSNPKI